MIVGLVGWIGAGKDTVADYLVTQHGFVQDSFAYSLKLAVSNVFGWPMEMLEGRTKEARAQREVVDEWWAKRLSIPHLTPRWVLQQWGTEVLRGGFHDDIWIASLESRLRNVKKNTVISDCRFPNEIAAIKAQGGKIVWVRRGPLPEWYDIAVDANKGNSLAMADLSQLNIHASETSWIGAEFDYIIDNNGTIDELYAAISKNLGLLEPASTEDDCVIIQSDSLHI
ncbi:MAG TPA: hypothetical protein VFM18_19275 [Methanosarcina sp.]|nr:hypothetical protein [Methanosarcina sp.]